MLALFCCYSRGMPATINIKTSRGNRQRETGYDGLMKLRRRYTK